jgi:TolB-like protein/DNA-binding winged helix-turn-helix (wHTH) protein/Flp pilus assembly protein TadD
MAIASQIRRVRFGAFEVDLASGELFKHGIRIKIQDQPFQILMMLLERPGELVSREELRRKLWADDTFVDFDAGMNAAIRRLRDALSDSAGQPRYIETLPRHGYRFIGKAENVYSEATPVISIVSPSAAVLAAPDLLGDTTPSPQSAVSPVRRGSGFLWLSAVAVTVGVVLSVGFGTADWRHRIFRAHASSRIQSIAILPLQNLSGDPSQEYFVDGMTDALTTNLAHIKSLRVISRTSAMHYKNSRELLAKIAEELEVDAVVEGSVVREGNRVRINTQLIEASTDRHIWAGSFEREMPDVLTLQDDAARSIATQIAANLTPEDKARLKDAKTVNPAAYEAYLKGAYFFGKETGEGFEKAKEYYEQSIHLDPAYAPAYVGLAETFAWQSYKGLQPPAEAWTKAENLLAKALEIDATSSDAHVLRGMIQLQFRCDRSGAEKNLNHALELDPGSVRALDYHSYYLLETGRTDEAIAEKTRVAALDPVSVGTSAELGLYFLVAGRNDDAIEQLKKSLELDPNFSVAHTRLGWAYANKMQYDQAISELQRAIALDHAPTKVGRLGEIYARAGRAEEALGVINELKEMSTHRYVPPALIAVIYARLGNDSQAITWLEKATGQDGLSLSDSVFDSLRSNPRFKVLEARLKSEQACPPF